MIEKWKYRIHLDKITYTPTEGLIQKAIQDSIDIAKFEKKPVELFVNDVTLTIKADSKTELVFHDYLKELDKKIAALKTHVQQPAIGKGSR